MHLPRFLTSIDPKNDLHKTSIRKFAIFKSHYSKSSINLHHPPDIKNSKFLCSSTTSSALETMESALRFNIATLRGRRIVRFVVFIAWHDTFGENPPRFDCAPRLLLVVNLINLSSKRSKRRVWERSSVNDQACQLDISASRTRLVIYEDHRRWNSEVEIVNDG